jgi:uncharacterized membrane protein
VQFFQLCAVFLSLPLLGAFRLFAAQVDPFVLGFLFSFCLSFSDRRGEKDWRIIFVVQNFLGVQKTRGASFFGTFFLLFRFRLVVNRSLILTAIGVRARLL